MLITDKPGDLPTTNALDDIEELSPAGVMPPAYLSFGTTPCAIENFADGDLVSQHGAGPWGARTGDAATARSGTNATSRSSDLVARRGRAEQEPEPAPKKKSAQEDAEAERVADDQLPLFDDAGDDLDEDQDDGDAAADPAGRGQRRAIRGPEVL